MTRMPVGLKWSAGEICHSWAKLTLTRMDVLMCFRADILLEILIVVISK